MNNEMIHARKWLIHTALAYLGRPYIWGGDDPSGFDCSGLVVECLKSVGLLAENEDFTADGLLRLYEAQTIKKAEAGCLLFRLNERGRATHVAICLDSQFQISAGGGSDTTLTPTDSWRHNAFVRIRPIRFHRGKTTLCVPFAENATGHAGIASG